ncbi:MAG: GntR family transcriptional regulator [Amylibacter sp.]|jgi:DNA-binding GntR family transcriptional regulator|tara:strand:+ start:1620 stop:2249 length:630 start_codon:yes stop_codon:yes gene_type:complete
MNAATGQTAYQAIYDEISSGKLIPGDRLRETELASRIGLSRTPIREAIKRLETEGVVTHKPQVGAVIKTLSQQEIVELYEMRIMLETSASSMAAKHASEAETRTLMTLNTKMLEARLDSYKVAELNRQFHICIVNAARNRYLANSYKNLSTILVILGHTTLTTPERVKSVFIQHQAIIDALSKGDDQEASGAMTIHMETSLDYRLLGLN